MSTGESISEAKNIKPLATLGNLKELQRRIENEVVVSAASGSQINNSNRTSNASPDNTIVSTTKPATPQGVMADAHIKTHKTYMKISNLENKVDALTEERDELKKELAKNKKEDGAGQFLRMLESGGFTSAQREVLNESVVEKMEEGKSLSWQELGASALDDEVTANYSKFFPGQGF